MLEKVDLETNLLRVHEWIRTADQKASIFLAFQGFVLTLLFESVSSWIARYLSSAPYMILILVLAGTTLIGFSVYKSISVVLPRLTKDGRKRSITYFGDIARFELSEFRKTLKEIQIDEYENELIDQIHVSSRIAAKKHVEFRDAIFAFFCGAILLALSSVLSRV